MCTNKCLVYIATINFPTLQRILENNYRQKGCNLGFYIIYCITEQIIILPENSTLFLQK